MVDSTPASSLRILIASHGHPQISKGGAEVAAYQLFHALCNSANYEPAFLACVREQKTRRLGVRISQPFSRREYLYCTESFDWFKFSNLDSTFPREFRALLHQLKPEILHFHHYINFGVEAFLHVRETLPKCKIVLTLHEYLALCNHYGQMITRPHRTLCYEESPIRCASCFKEIEPSDFFLRKLYIQRFFELVDRFVAPSEFLAERYVVWGIPRERIAVIENIIPGSLNEELAADAPNAEDILRVGFFGQISVLKGVNVLFEAAEILAEQGAHNIVFEIYGDYSIQPAEFQADFLDRISKVGRNVKFQGPYDQERVDLLMQAVDVIVVPSIWWENSPIVIQEALRNRRPVICSDIGGMAEKIRNGVDGFHFPVGNSVALAALLQKLAREPDRISVVRKSMRSPLTVSEALEKHSDLYRSLVVTDGDRTRSGGNKRRSDTEVFLA